MGPEIKIQPKTEVFIAKARLRKALKLAKVIVQAGGSADAISHPVDSITTRRLAEKVAGVNESSDATWAMVAVLLEGDA